MRNLIMGAPWNWCKNVLEWNLASDPTQSIHTSGGCSQCLGAVTIDGNTVTRNPAYYIIAHAAKFVRPGSARIYSTTPSTLPNVGFKTTDGKRVLIVMNDNTTPTVFQIVSGSTTITSQLNAASVGTYIW
jgi:glucosylceramidase